MFTNLSVTWFRSTLEDISSYEVVPTDSKESQYYNSYYRYLSSITTLSAGNCSSDIYRDVFALVISNFTREKNGYYWCQLAINNTYAQRSHHAWFYADESTSTTCSSLSYFRLALPNQTVCAYYTMNTPVLSTATLSVVSSTTTILVERSFPTKLPMTTESAAMQNKILSEDPLIYILGSFSALLFLTFVGVLMLSFSFILYVYHLKKKNSKSW